MHGITILISCISALFSALVGLLIWRLQRVLERREKARIEHEVLVVKGTRAAIALSEATAIALRDGHTNGDTQKALEYAQQVKHAQKDFLTEQGIKNLF